MFGDRNYKKAKKFVFSKLPLNLSKEQEKIYNDNFHDIVKIKGYMSCYTDDPVYDNIATVVIREDVDSGGTIELSSFEQASIEAMYLDPTAKSFFDLRNVVDYMNEYTPEPVYRAFEDAGRPLCREILDKVENDLDSVKNSSMATKSFVCLVKMYKDGIEREDTKLAWELFPLFPTNGLELLTKYHSVDELPNEVIYRAWEEAHKANYLMEDDLEIEMQKREPDTPEAMRIYEEWQEQNNELEY